MKYLFALMLVTKLSAWAQNEIKVKENIKQQAITAKANSVKDRSPSGSKQLTITKQKAQKSLVQRNR